jgi:hypothetical protein
MATDDSSTRLSLRRPETGAVLVVVLLAMIALLGLGLTGLYLTSGSIQMNSNINMRNQALYVAEAGIQAARSVLNRIPAGNPTWTPPLGNMLSGMDPGGNPVALPTGISDEIPWDPNGCLGTNSDGTPGRGAYLRDNIPTGCLSNTAYVNCNYPNYSSTVARNEATPDNNNPVLTPFMGQYTLFIRQDLAECRQGLFTTENYPSGIPATNGIVVIRSEGVASDSRTKVVLEVTMSPNSAATPVQVGVATVCPAGAAGCDDNASVQQGLTVSGSLTPPPPGVGGAVGGASDTGAGGAGGATGGAAGQSASAGSSGTGGVGGGTSPVATGTGGNGSGGQAGSSAGGTGGGCGTGCPSGRICCSGACRTPSATNSNTSCGPCAIACDSSQTCCTNSGSGVCQTTNTTDSNSACGPCAISCGAAQICCSEECITPATCPTIATMGIFGVYDAKFSHYDGKGITDGSNTGALVSTGASTMQKWINQHSANCVAPNIDLTTQDLTTVPLYQYQVILILDLFHTQTDVQAYFAAKNGGQSSTYGTIGHQRLLSDAELTAFQNWYAAGGKGFMTTIGVANGPYGEPTNVNKLLAPFGIQYDPNTPGNDTFGQTTVHVADLKTTCPVALPLTQGVSTLFLRHGYSVLSTGLTESSTFSAYVKPLQSYNSGVARILNKTSGGIPIDPPARVNVWGDEWITYDDVWAGYAAGPYWDNALAWLSPECLRPPGPCH